MKKKLRVAFCGEEGSFTHSAAIKLYGDDCEYIGITSFTRVFDEVASNRADAGVLPIENTLAGSLYEHYDALERANVHVCQEIVLRIEHHLLVQDGCTVDQLEKVYSHPKALQQCSMFFEEHPQIQAIAVSDTATAAKLVSEGDGRTGAIASKDCAGLYGLNDCGMTVEDSPQNYSRFFAVEGYGSERHEGDKCSLLLSIAHTPGQLYKVLECFHSEGLNLTKIDSRPLKEKPFEYLFYIDIEGELSKRLVDKLNELVNSIKILGSYSRSQKWMN